MSRCSSAPKTVGASSGSFESGLIVACPSRRVTFVGIDDVLHDAVANDVARTELDEHEPVDAFEHVAHRSRPERPRPSGRSIWVTSPVTTTFDPNPSRVRNIFICSGVVFCASSRMMNESLSVRPRMYASGATSIVPRSMSRDDDLRVEHVVQRVVQRPQVRIDLREDVAGQEAEPLAGLDRGPGEDDAVDCLRLQGLHRERDREVALAGTGRPDRERHGVVAHRVDVALLARGLGADRLAAAHDFGA